MKNFANLYTELDQTTKTLGKVDALVQYLESAKEDDKLWAVALLSHRRPKRTVNTNLLRLWAAEEGQVPLWLFEESYHVVGDLAETISLILPQAELKSDESLAFWINFIRSLESLSIEEKKARIIWSWQRLDDVERFVFNKLITGSFRVGVSQQLIVKALAKYTQVKENIIAHRLMGHWSPETFSIKQLISEVSEKPDFSKPYPFYLAYALEMDIEMLGDPSEWIAERKWDGIRGQVIVRNQQLFVWSRGEELVTDKYPEYKVMLDLLSEGTVIDGEILPFKGDSPMPFSSLQTRIGRKVLNARLLKDVPISFVVYDLLEYGGADYRNLPMHERRKKLEELCREGNDVLRLSPIIKFSTWSELAAERDRSREFFSEGIMLKHRNSIYRNGRRKGDWWKWKIDPLTVDAVLIYAMAGHGRRANLYTDYTFAVREGEALIPFAKAYSGLTDEEINEVDRWVRRNTLERFGPVRSVKPELVFEIAFEGINQSSRHKAGIAVRFPRIHRWRRDKKADEVNTMEDLRQLLKNSEQVI